MRVRSRKMYNNRLADSMVKPDTISIAKNASLIKIKDDVMVLVIIAKITRNPIANIRKGVSRITIIQVNMIVKREKKELFLFFTFYANCNDQHPPFIQ